MRYRPHFSVRSAPAVAVLATALSALHAVPLAAQTNATSPLVDRVAVGTLMVDRTEVTIAQFAHFAQATGTVTRAEREGGGFEYLGGWQRRPGWTWRTPDGVAPASRQLPAVHLTHAEAEAYCRWAGARLPTAAEWTSAAYTEQRADPPAPFVRGTTYPYPTGTTPQGANTSDTDPWPRRLGMGQRRPGQRPPHHGRFVVVRRQPDARRGQRLESGGLLCGVHRVPVCGGGELSRPRCLRSSPRFPETLSSTTRLCASHNCRGKTRQLLGLGCIRPCSLGWGGSLGCNALEGSASPRGKRWQRCTRDRFPNALSRTSAGHEPHLFHRLSEPAKCGLRSA